MRWATLTTCRLLAALAGSGGGTIGDLTGEGKKEGYGL
jgi:hypothetical protein